MVHGVPRAALRPWSCPLPGTAALAAHATAPPHAPSSSLSIDRGQVQGVRQHCGIGELLESHRQRALDTADVKSKPNGPCLTQRGRS
jgi:hypothetical protein